MLSSTWLVPSQKEIIGFCWKPLVSSTQRCWCGLGPIKATGYTTCQKSGACFFLTQKQKGSSPFFFGWRPTCTNVFGPFFVAKKRVLLCFALLFCNFFDGLNSSRLWRVVGFLFFFFFPVVVQVGKVLWMDFRLVPCHSKLAEVQTDLQLEDGCGPFLWAQIWHVSRFWDFWRFFGFEGRMGNTTLIHSNDDKIEQEIWRFSYMIPYYPSMKGHFFCWVCCRKKYWGSFSDSLYKSVWLLKFAGDVEKRWLCPEVFI